MAAEEDPFSGLFEMGKDGPAGGDVPAEAPADEYSGLFQGGGSMSGSGRRKRRGGDKRVFSALLKTLTS